MGQFHFISCCIGHVNRSTNDIIKVLPDKETPVGAKDAQQFGQTHRKKHNFIPVAVIFGFIFCWFCILMLVFLLPYNLQP